MKKPVARPQQLLDAGVADRDLAAQVQLEAEAFVVDHLAQGEEGRLQAGGVVVPEARMAQMRGGHQLGGPLLGGQPANGQRLLEIRGAVVDPGQDVAVQIDHGLRAPWRATGPSPPPPPEDGKGGEPIKGGARPPAPFEGELEGGSPPIGILPPSRPRERG